MQSFVDSIGLYLQSCILVLENVLCDLFFSIEDQIKIQHGKREHTDNDKAKQKLAIQ